MIVDVIDLNINNLNFSKRYDTARNQRAKTIYRYENVDIEQVEERRDGTYKVSANVEGSYTYYDVNLEINGNMVKEYYCDCQDYQNGYICKHILATCMEVIEPHKASTPEGRKRQAIKDRQEREEALSLWKLKQEEERKRREYETRYNRALTAITEYKREQALSNNMYSEIKNINLRDLYRETKEKQMLTNTYSPELSTNVELEPQIELSGNNDMVVTFKIGETQKYVLKDICELYYAFQTKEILQYGKKLKFIAQEDSFAKEDIKLLDFILKYGEILHYSEEINRNSYYYYSTRVSTKYMSLHQNKIDEFFEIIKNRPIQISKYDKKEIYKFTDELLNIELNIKRVEKSKEYILNINLNDYEYILSDKKIYILVNNKIYTFNQEKNKELTNVLKLFRYDKEILIPEDKIKEFSTYILPKVEKYLPTQNLPEESVKEAVLVNKLASKMFLDLDDNGNITMELKFCYNDCEFNILDPDHEKYVKQKKIERNMFEERKVLTRIFTDGFELINGRRYFILKNLDDTYEFLSNKINQYMNDFEILVTEKFKSKEIKRPKLSSVSIKLDSGLLELDISKLDFDINEIKNVLKNYNIKKKYYKLKNGDFLSLEQSEDLDFLSDMSNSFDINYDKIDKGVIKLPVNRSIYLDQLLNKNKEINTTKNDDFNNLVNNIENKNFSENIKLDKKFEKILRDYQKTGYKWLKVLENYKMGGILADDMGLGKTLQVIALLADNMKGKQTSIVVCPSSLVLNWKAEIEKWCPTLKVSIIKGFAEDRKKLINEYENYNVLVTSYDLLKRDIEEYEGKSFKYIIADEAQYIKNFTTQNATALKSLEGEIKFALTGTPIENSVSELWSIFDFIMPGYLYSYNKFRKKLEEPILKQEDKEALKRLKTLINPFILRRVKKDVLTELPEKNITVMKNEMTDEQQKIYMSYFAQTKKEVSEELSENGFEKSKFKILMLLTRLRQICCHPSLFIDNYNGESGKLNQCIDIIKEAIDSGHKILLFSSYTSMFDIIEKELIKKNVKYYKLTGSTPVSKRVDMVEQFNNDGSIKIFLISLKAGGTGLNLTGADVVIHYDPWWNLSIENQATDRAYRIGQKNSVQVYKLITTNSIEEKINKLQEKKAKISEELLSTEETFINKLSKEEIMELFN